MLYLSNYTQLLNFFDSKCEYSRSSGVELICEKQACLVEEAVINNVNSQRQLGWQASNYSIFWGRTLSDGILYRTGTLEPHNTVSLSIYLWTYAAQ